MAENTWLIIGTWNFSLPGVTQAALMLAEKRTCLDAVEKAVNIVEEDPLVHSVGLGAIPNEDGEVEVDAGIMDGRNLRTGAVAGIKDYLHAVSIARRIMSDTRHNFLVGKGAEEFARRKGFKKVRLLTKKGAAIWKERMSGKRPRVYGHDTIGVVALDQMGNMAAATSSSGIALKMKSRIGDSPVIGAGFYVDNEVGGAAATGVGEFIMKGCLCFHAVDLMRQGYAPQRAARTALKRLHQRFRRGHSAAGKMALICCDNRGNSGGAANHPYFRYAIASNKTGPRLIRVSSIKEGL